MKNEKVSDNKKEEKIKESQSSWFFDLLMNFVPDDKNIHIEGKTPEKMIRNAALFSGSISGIASIPPGFFGWFTILPDLIFVTKIQMNLIYKIAKFYKQEKKVNATTLAMIFSKYSEQQKVVSAARGKISEKINEEIIIKTTTKIITKGSEKIEVMVIQKISKESLQVFLRKLSAKLASIITSRLFAKFLIGISVIIFSVISYKATKQIGIDAKEFFSKEIEFEE
jgi:hypothetical protein